MMLEPTLFDVEPLPAPSPHVCQAVGRCTCGRFAAQPMLHQGDPRTSRKAAQTVANPDRLSRTQRAILQNLYHASAQGPHAGFSDFQHPGILQTTAGKRRLELQRAGLVEDAGWETNNAHGSDVIVWRITAEGRAAYEASQS